MASQPSSTVARQVTRVSRRLFVQTLLDHLAWSWAGALALTAGWFLLHPLLFGPPQEWFRWTVIGGVLGVGTLLALILAWWRAPSPLAAALALDERFRLKERVTTSLTLGPGEVQTPAAQALLADVNQHVQPLQVKERFPVRLSWSAALVPVCAAVLAVVALFYEPTLGTATADSGKDNKDPGLNAKDVQKQFHNLKKAPRDWLKDQPKSEEMKEIAAAWDKLVNKPLDPNNKEQVRERVEAIRDLEEKMKDRLEGLKSKADKSNALKQQLGKLHPNDRGNKAGFKDGPAKALQDALAKGDVAKAKDEVERMMKKLQEEKMKPEEQKQLEDQLAELQNKLKRLADLKDQKDQLQRDRQQGKIDQDQLEREMDRLAEQARGLEELNDLALDLDECLQCMRSGNSKGAAGKLARALKMLEQLELDEQELRDLMNAQADLEEAREGLCQCLNGQCEGEKNSLGGRSRRPGTLRPIAPDAPTNTQDARQRAEVDPQGKQRITGFTRGGSFTKVPAREVGGVFRQAVQEAPEAIERQRVPADATDMLRGYYENLGGQKKN
jgi:hypothetical protein